jgi:hypothetical protein
MGVAVKSELCVETVIKFLLVGVRFIEAGLLSAPNSPLTPCSVIASGRSGRAQGVLGSTQ